MINYQTFQLLRLSDDLIYTFDRIISDGGRIEYKRRDQDLRIIYHSPKLGWVAYDEVSQLVMGRPWNIHPDEQESIHPPEGEWVSKKGEKSYVYELQYIQE